MLNFIKKLLGKKIDMAYEEEFRPKYAQAKMFIVDDENKCACNKCNEHLYNLYLEKNDILKTAEIICLNKREF